MCGRFTLTSTDDLLAGLPFDVFSDTRLPFQPRYNVAPGQTCHIVLLNGGQAILRDAQWGLPASAGTSQPIINARSETAASKRMFAQAWRDGRCLVPADGFFEWRAEGKLKQPYWFTRQGGGVFWMAGLQWGGRFVILTKAPDETVRNFHDRMPVILDADHVERWLKHAEIEAHPRLGARAVSALVNRVANDGPECVAPVAQQALPFDDVALTHALRKRD